MMAVRTTLKGRQLPDNLKDYVEGVLAPHMKQWDEAMRAATLWYLVRQLGVKKIAYYGFETGARLKGFGHKECKPPKSLYTQLPKRFCMEKSNDLPDLLANCGERQVRKILKDHTPEFWHLPEDLSLSTPNPTTIH